MGTLEPVWNYIGTIPDHMEGDSLVFTVYDKDTGKSDDLLGTVTLTAQQFLQGFAGELALQDAGKGIQAFLKVKIVPRDGRKLSIKTPAPSKPPVPLQVTVVGARGLRDADWMPGGGKSDPYCVCEIPQKPQSKFQTPVIDNTLDPEWNYTTTLQDHVEGDSLVFSVYDKDTGKSDDFLGTVTLKSQHFLRGYEGELPLEDAGKGIQAFLKLKIVPLHGPPPNAPRSTRRTRCGTRWLSCKSGGGGTPTCRRVRGKRRL